MKAAWYEKQGPPATYWWWGKWTIRSLPAANREGSHSAWHCGTPDEANRHAPVLE